MSPIGKYEPILRIAELGSLTRAAESLGYSQSSLSHLTANLEKELGVKLFRRERQGVTLTPAGTELLGIMEEIEAKENKLRVAAAAQQSSTLRIGTLPSITATWLPTLLVGFRRIGFISTVGSISAASACMAWARPISRPSFVM